jgi:hypothetical protein
MQERPATKATLARVARDAPSVRAMNDGTTASGFTIVNNAVNDRRAIFQRGTPSEFTVLVGRFEVRGSREEVREDAFCVHVSSLFIRTSNLESRFLIN